MAYFVHVAQPVKDYVDGVQELPAPRRQKILEALVNDLEQRAEHFFKTFPLAHESYSFYYDYAFIEGDLIWSFRFVCGAESMPAGVVQVKFVDSEMLPLA